MSGKKGRGVWGEGMMDETWQWAGDLARDTGCALQVSLVPTERLHVWRVVVRILEVVDGRPAGVRLSHTVLWPDATYSTLPATILQAVSHLALRATEDPLQQRSAG